MSVMENPTIDIPESIQCGICSQVCKRGVKVKYQTEESVESFKLQPPGVVL